MLIRLALLILMLIQNTWYTRALLLDSVSDSYHWVRYELVVVLACSFIVLMIYIDYHDFVTLFSL